MGFPPIHGLWCLLFFSMAYTAHNMNVASTLFTSQQTINAVAAKENRPLRQLLLQDESKDATMLTSTEEDLKAIKKKVRNQERRGERGKNATSRQNKKATSSAKSVDQSEEPRLEQQGQATKEATSSIRQSEKAVSREDKVFANDGSESEILRNKLIGQWETFYKETKKHLPELTKYPDKYGRKIGVDTLPHRKVPDFIRGTYNNNTNDVILATHMSMDNNRMDRLDILQGFWQGPISLAVRIRSAEQVDFFFDHYQQLPTNITSTWTVHFLFEYFESFDPESFAAQYCHNQLRNLALHSPSIPDFVLAIDLDFIPTYGGYPKMMQIMEQHPDLWDKLKSKNLLVFPVMEIPHIPDKVASNSAGFVDFVHGLDKLGVNTTSLKKAWDTKDILEGKKKKLSVVTKKLNAIQRVDPFSEGRASDLPHSREELQIMYRFKMAQRWHAKKGHQATNLKKYWRYEPGVTTNTTYPVKPCNRYEPYFLGYKPDMPRYWEGFRGYGFNKQSFARECLLAGFRMEALYELYLTHLAHPSNKNDTLRAANQLEWQRRFAPYLRMNYLKPEWLEGSDSDWYSVAAAQYIKPSNQTAAETAEA